MTPILVSRSNEYCSFDFLDRDFLGASIYSMGSTIPRQEQVAKSEERDFVAEEFIDVSVGASGSKRRKAQTSEMPRSTLGEGFEVFDKQGDASYSQGSKRRRHSSEQGQQGYKWSREEEAFLVGAIMQRFFSYGSLTSSRRSDEDNVWEYIKTVFDERREKYAIAIGKLPPRERTQNALQRHWKLMKASSNRSFYALYKLWEKLYGEACGTTHG